MNYDDIEEKINNNQTLCKGLLKIFSTCAGGKMFDKDDDWYDSASDNAKFKSWDTVEGKVNNYAFTFWSPRRSEVVERSLMDNGAPNSWSYVGMQRQGSKIKIEIDGTSYNVEFDKSGKAASYNEEKKLSK